MMKFAMQSLKQHKYFRSMVYYNCMFHVQKFNCRLKVIIAPVTQVTNNILMPHFIYWDNFKSHVPCSKVLTRFLNSRIVTQWTDAEKKMA